MGKDFGSLDDFFGTGPIILKGEDCVCHSGGAVGADTVFEEIGAEYGVATRAYSYKTKKHNSPNKVEISEEDYTEGVSQINKANRRLGRYGVQKYMNLLARNWAQVKYSRQVFAIGTIIDPGKRDEKGYRNGWKQQVVSGGTGYAVMMAVLNSRDIYVYEQKIKSWFRWSAVSEKFIKLDSCPKITDRNFAGIGTREINTDGVDAVRELYKISFGR
jgi:hypothetical protein